MKYIIYLCGAFFLFLCGQLKAQEEAVYTQYFINPAWVNPAYTGFDNDHNLFLNYRNQWADFDGSLRNYSANYHGAVTDRIGLGVLVGVESIGEFEDFRAGLSYAYRFGEETDWKMSIGLNTEYESYSVNGSILSNPNIDPSDPILAEALDGVQFFNVGAGFYGEYDERFFVGLSLPKMINARIDDVDYGEDENEFFRYFTFMAGYRIDIEDYDIKLEPSIFMKRLENVDFQFDANLKALFLDEQLIGGITYSNGTGDRLGFLIGTQLQAFRLYYSYDVSFQQYQDYANGSHELTLGFKWGGTNSNQKDTGDMNN